MAKAKSPAAKASAKPRQGGIAKKAVVKKSIIKKAVPAKKPAPPAWNTIHVFGYGESQAIGKEINGKAPNGELKAIAPLLEHLAKKQQKGTKIKMDALHALNIFNGMFVDFHSRDKENKSQRFAWADVDSKQINKLADEIKAKIKAAPKPVRSGRKDNVQTPFGREATVHAIISRRKNIATKGKK